MARVRVERKDETAYRESATFSHKDAAKAWLSKREIEMREPGALRRAASPKPIISELITRYIEEFESRAKWQRSKGVALRALRGMDIAKHDAATLTVADLLDHVRRRRDAGTGPATAMNDLVWLGVVYRAAAGSWGLPVDPGVVALARSQAREHRLIALTPGDGRGVRQRRR